MRVSKRYCSPALRTAVVTAMVLTINLGHAGPYVFWVNNNYDRWHNIDCTPIIGGNCDSEQDDLGPLDIAKLPAYQQVPDCNYVNASGQRVIPCTRDLEDFARLWMAGVFSNLVAALPANSTLTLSWTDYDGEPTIDLFAAVEPDGGNRWQTDPTVATNQIDPVQAPYLGRVGPGQPIQFTKSTWRTSQFIWCGVKYGGGGLTLTIADGNSNVLAQTTSYIALVDIKQMYERWTVGERPGFPPQPLRNSGWKASRPANPRPSSARPTPPIRLTSFSFTAGTWKRGKKTAMPRRLSNGSTGRAIRAALAVSGGRPAINSQGSSVRLPMPTTTTTASRTPGHQQPACLIC